MLTRTIGRYLSWPIDRLAFLLARTGVPPNVITWSALALNLWACIFFAAGRFAAAGGLMILAGLCDLLDGPVARRQKRVSKFGGFLESILDRYSDLMLFLGLLVYYVRVNRFPYAILAGIAMAGAVMVSYARARAESLGPTSEVGFWERPERMVLMIVGALANQMGLALWILAIGPNISVIHRIVHTWQQTEGKLREQRASAAPSSSARPANAPPETAAILSRSAGRGS
ncbi:MAG TPA: CDP-alcohol phosphatidyltransferase family protein [Candidatus Acidoferrales bacterium]|nr:CDP-alcohol phosphatidyltransferase family protein [Candidatus Acidoferrales bacterium]